MADSPTQLAPLTPEQQEIVDFPVDVPVLVTAGAGTGKTHVLANRLAALAETRGLRPGTDLLVLSFSRAAVSEIRRRTAAAGGAVAYAPAMTFDAFATYLLSVVDPNGNWRERGFDGRIEVAVRSLTENPAAVEEIRRYRHILVDEIQDLVGRRAELVRAVLSACDCGFTLLGDPAQSIYGYRLRRDEVGTGSEELYEFVRSTFVGRLVERRLTANFRARSETAKAVTAFGRRLGGPRPDYAEIRRDIDTFVLGLPPVGDMLVIAPLLRRRERGTTVVLCRTNGQALLVSRRLSELGIEHGLQREATDRAAAGWIAAALDGLSLPRVGRARFLERLDGLSGDASLSAEQMWSLLKLLAPSRADELDVRMVAERIRTGAIPEELNQVRETDVVVSSIHRAKGLEFDRVILLEPGPHDPDREDLPEETRLLYVALSRARDEICIAHPPDTGGLARSRPPVSRWVRRGFGRDRWRIREVEVRGSDTHWMAPAGAFKVLLEDVRGAQEYIRSRVRAGDPVSLVLVSSADEGEPCAFYSVVHYDRVVGVTSEGFSSDLQRLLGGRDVRWPQRISDLLVEGVDAVAGSPAVARRNGLGAAGVWSRVRVYGLGKLEYEGTASDRCDDGVR